jgi:hypothetical protein
MYVLVHEYLNGYVIVSRHRTPDGARKAAIAAARREVLDRYDDPRIARHKYPSLFGDNAGKNDAMDFGYIVKTEEGWRAGR